MSGKGTTFGSMYSRLSPASAFHRRGLINAPAAISLLAGVGVTRALGQPGASNRGAADARPFVDARLKARVRGGPTI